MDRPLGHRARSVEELGQLFDQLMSAEDVEASIRSWRPRPTDVVIAPFAKCGTTWLQQIFHTLRTRGDMDFDDVSSVVPWIETAVTLDMDLEAPQRAEPRGFKSHLPFHRMPLGAKTIVALRDPKDALVSVFRFFEGWLLEAGALTIEQFAPCRIDVPPDRGYFGHLVSWWEQRHRPDVLLLSYERMTAAPEETIRRVAAFSGIALDDELLALTLARSSLAFMLEHQSQFSEAPMQRAAERRCGLPPGIGGAKVRRGAVGAHRDELPAEVAEAIDRRWHELVTPRFGFTNYAEMERALHA